jgi:biotin carboxyl carrier protein
VDAAARLADVMAPRSSHSVQVGDERFAVEIDEVGQVRIAGIDGTWSVRAAPDAGYLVSKGETRYRVFVAGGGDRLQAFVDGEFYELVVEREGRGGRTAARGHVEPITVPMPARVIKVLVTVGQAVKRGDVLVTLEAMKMELPLKAPRDGNVRAIACREGDLVQPGAPVVELA